MNVRDVYTSFELNGKGRSGGNQLLRRSSINWECKVTEVVRCAGYFLGLDENGIIEVIPEDRETEIVQTITESGLLHLIQGDGQILGYSSTDIYILTPAPLSQRIDECIANVRVEEAFRLIHLVYTIFDTCKNAFTNMFAKLQYYNRNLF